MPEFPSIALVRRELLRGVRDGRMFMCAIVLLAVAAMVMLSMWVSIMDRPLTAVARMSENLMTFFSLIMLVGAMLFVPAVGAGTIVTEREQDTFEQVSLTLIRPSGFIAAKFINAVGLYVLLLISCMPVFGCFFFLIGLNVSAICFALVVVIETVFSCGMIGIYFSSRCHNTVVAIPGTFLTVAIMMGGHILIAIILAEVFNVGGPVERGLVQVALVVSPYATLVSLLQGFTDWSTIAWATSYHLCITIAAFVGARKWLYRDVSPVVRQVARPRLRRGLPQFSRAVRPPRPDTLSTLFRNRPIPDHVNPMFFKEFRWDVALRGRTLVWIYLGVQAVSGLVGVVIFLAGMQHGYILRRSSMDGPYMAMGICMLFGNMVLTPLFLANIIAKEFETRNIDMLRLTLLKDWQILTGKIFAGALLLTPMILATFISFTPFFLLAFFIGIEEFVLLTVITYFVCLAVSLTTSVLCATLAKRTTTTIIGSYLLGGLLFIGLALGTLFFGEMYRSSRIEIVRNLARYFREETSALLSPSVAYVVCLDRNKPEIWIISMIAFTVVACGMLLLAYVRFSKRRDG